MKIATLIMILAIMQLSAVTRAQKITLSVRNAPISTVFQQIRSQTGYDFAYTTKTLEGTKTVTINARDEGLKSVLDRIFEGQPINYSIEDKLVVVSIKEKTDPEPIREKGRAAPIIVAGKVVDENGQPLPGVTIRMQGSNGGRTTNKNGRFELAVRDDKAVLQFSFIGFEPKEMAVVNLKKPIMVVLKESVGSLDEVQVLAYGTTTKRYST